MTVGESGSWGKIIASSIPGGQGPVGEELFGDSTSSRHWCIKRCLLCGTHYKWDFDYEYLVGGSEDEVTLTRLSESQKKIWVDKVNTAIENLKKKFEKKVPSLIAALDVSNKVKKIRKAVDYIFHVQLCENQDVSALIPSLVHVLAHHQHKKRNVHSSCPVKLHIREIQST